MNKKQELQTIVLSEYTTEAQKQAAQIALDALDNPAPVATPAPAAPASASVRGAKPHMWWIPEPTPEERIAFAKLRADFRADIDARMAKEKAEKAEIAAKTVTPQDANKARLLAVVNDATAPEERVIEANLELATMEIDELREARARRMMRDPNAS